MTNAGWHPDPLGRHQLRYFDGDAWTPHVVDGSDLSFDPLAAARPEDAPDAAASDSPVAARAPTRTRRVQRLVLLGIVIAIVGVVLVAVAFASSPSGEKSATVHASFAIRNGPQGPGYLLRLGGCEGKGTFQDLNPHTPVVIEGDFGEKLTRTTLGPGHFVGDACVFRFTFTVEKGAAYYVVSVGGRSTGEYTFAQLEQPDSVALALGAPQKKG
jgi:uncharacterized protein DUF2510